MLIYISIGLYLITFVLLLVSSIRSHKSVHRFVFKLINCFLFIVVSIISFLYRHIELSYFIPLLVAQIFSFIGDLFLGVNHLEKKTKYGALGIVSFALAQIVFIFTFIYNYGFIPYLLFIPVLGLIVGEYIIYRLHIKDKKLYLSGGFYLLLMTSMVMATLGALILDPSWCSLIIFIGGLSFMVSDYTLMFKYYYPSKRIVFTTVSVSTYALAQLLFALSVTLF